MSVHALAAAALLLAGLLDSGRAHASGGPYVVDDADIIAAGTCQIETWRSRRGDGADLPALAPGCHFGGAEWSLFGLHTRAAGDGDTSLAVQGKWLLRPIETGGVGIALAVGGGTQRRMDGRLSEVFAYLPVSLEPVESLRLHLNIGSLRDRDSHRWSTTWGGGFDWALAPRLHLLGEHFGDDRGEHGYQAGLRPILVEDALHLDLTWTRSFGSTRDRGWTLGAVWAF